MASDLARGPQIAFLRPTAHRQARSRQRADLDFDVGILVPAYPRDVLGTGRDCNDRAHLGAKDDVVARFGVRRQQLDPFVRRPRKVREQIPRLRREREFDVSAGEHIMHVILAIPVIALVAERLEPGLVAGREQHVVLTRRVVFDHGHDRPSNIGYGGLPGSDFHTEIGDPRVTYGQILGRIALIDRPKIDRLLAFQIG